MSIITPEQAQRAKMRREREHHSDCVSIPDPALVEQRNQEERNYKRRMAAAVLAIYVLLGVLAYIGATSP